MNGTRQRVTTYAQRNPRPGLSPAAGFTTGFVYDLSGGRAVY